MRKQKKDVIVLRKGDTFEATYKGEELPFLKVFVLKKKENGMIRLKFEADYKQIRNLRESELENMTGMIDADNHIITLAIRDIVRILFCEGKGVYARFSKENEDEAKQKSCLSAFLKQAGLVVNDDGAETVYFATRPV